MLWKIGEMAGLAEASRILAEACAATGEAADHWIHSLGEAYAREALLGVAGLAAWIMHAGPHPQAADLDELLQRANAAQAGLFAHRDKLGQVLLQAH